ncbi:hypothetical protein OFQ51_04525 [Brachyspira hyodysenteriae]|nr:hypothetical protein [Brachyspira hyodysenteriae]MCZ9949910.1 hypothetical protein [Brachyspira hyodysenteriae]
MRLLWDNIFNNFEYTFSSEDDFFPISNMFNYQTLEVGKFKSESEGSLTLSGNGIINEIAVFNTNAQKIKLEITNTENNTLIYNINIINKQAIHNIAAVEFIKVKITFIKDEDSNILECGYLIIGEGVDFPPHDKQKTHTINYTHNQYFSLTGHYFYRKLPFRSYDTWKVSFPYLTNDDREKIINFFDISNFEPFILQVWREEIISPDEILESEIETAKYNISKYGLSKYASKTNTMTKTAIGIMENSQKQSLLKEIKQLQNRQKVALGLYEQERIKAELEEKQKELAKIQIEEEAKAKQMEVEKNYNNEKMRLEYNSQMESWKMSLAQATASIAQAGISALASAMAVPFPANLAAYATLLGIIAAGSVNLATLSQAKPQEPKYLAKGGLVERRNGGINAVIGEGVSDEAVIPLEDRILSKIGSQIFEAAKNNDGIYEVNTQSETSFNQPVYLMLDGKVVAGTMLNLSKRGVKVVSQRGIL